MYQVFHSGKSIYLEIKLINLLFFFFFFIFSLLITRGVAPKTCLNGSAWGERAHRKPYVEVPSGDQTPIEKERIYIHIIKKRLLGGWGF